MNQTRYDYGHNPVATKIESNMRLTIEELSMLNKFEACALKLNIHFYREDVVGYKYIELDEMNPSLIKGFDRIIEMNLASNIHRDDTDENEAPQYMRVFDPEEFSLLEIQYNKGIKLHPDGQQMEANRRALIDAVKMTKKNTLSPARTQVPAPIINEAVAAELARERNADVDKYADAPEEAIIQDMEPVEEMSMFDDLPVGGDVISEDAAPLVTDDLQDAIEDAGLGTEAG